MFLKNKYKKVIYFLRFQKNMKNIELYRTIEALADAKKQQYTPNKPLSAQQYCRKQIGKKKLIPSNPKSKMNQIMKKFNQLDTYVDVEKLFTYVYQIIAAKQKENHKQHQHFYLKTKKSINLENDDILSNVREKLGPYNQKIFMKENQSLNQLIQCLQEQQGILRTQNNPLVMADCKNISKKNNVNMSYQKEKQKWNFYQGNSYVFGSQNEKKKRQKPQIIKLSIQKSAIKKAQQNNQLIHQVSTYLQIILQKHHRKKWGHKQKNIQPINNQTQITQQSDLMEKKSNLRSQRTSTAQNVKKLFLKTVLQSKKPQQQSTMIQVDKLFSFDQGPTENSFLNKKYCFKHNLSANESKLSSKYLSTNQQTRKLNNYKVKKVDVNQNFTFRNRNIKQNLINKISSFLDYVENEQKQFKKQKNYSINKLNNFQNKQKIYNYKYGYNYFNMDDQEVKEVQNKVKMQK